MEQPPAVATTPAAAAAPTPQQEKQQEKQLAWASPPRPPFAGEGIDNNADANAGASTSTSSTSAAESALAAHYSRKLVKLRALVADAHFRGKDLAGKGGRRERRERKKERALVFLPLLLALSTLKHSTLDPLKREKKKNSQTKSTTPP